jgi:putative PIN family toxin of toxin-antitoxin system
VRVVLDTNVIVSATLIRGGNEDRILRAWQRGMFDLVLSHEIIEELARALSYDKLRKSRWITDEDTLELLETLARSSVLVPGRVKVKASRDPADDKFLVAALEGEAAFVVTGDRDLLDLMHYREIRIVRPARFLEIIERAGDRA